MGYDAAILDVDGVITHTARLHEQAWKELFDEVLAPRGEPLFTRADYLAHVDGKPRLAGLRDFLISRGIALPADEIERLAARKNAIFHRLLAEGSVEIFDDAVRQVRDWRRQGLGIAFVTSSRNAPAILAQAGLNRLADVQIDGGMAHDLGLAGKPEMFREAARRLEVTHDRALVVEDAAAGVAAAASEGFGLVVGIARDGGEALLMDQGAHRVVRRLDALADVAEPGTRAPAALPSALRMPLVDAHLDGRDPSLFLEHALMVQLLKRAPEEIRRVLTELVARCPVGVVTGRDACEVYRELGVPGVWVGPVPAVLEPERAPLQVGFGEPVDLPCGVGVLVGSPLRPTRASLRLEGVEAVVALLRGLLGWLRDREEAGWSLRYAGYDPAREGLREALCTLGNGVFATRGAAEESSADAHHYPGTYVAGGYDALPTPMQGEVLVHEDLVNWPNWLLLAFRPEGGDWLDLDRMEVLSHGQVLDVRRGLLTRTVRVRDAAGRTTALTTTRFVSMDLPQVAVIRQEIVPEDWSGIAIVRSGLDGAIRNAGVARYDALRGDHLVAETAGQLGDALHLTVRTRSSRIGMAQVARTRVREGEELTRGLQLWDGRVEEHIRVRVVAGEPLTVEKTVVIRTSRDAALDDPLSDARRQLAQLPDFAALRLGHARKWAQLWRRCDLRLGDGHDEAQRNLRIHLFHLMQVTSPHVADRDVGVPARGLHGEAYRGHVFWDELFVFPCLDTLFPTLSRELLMYRYRRLDAARRLAREEGHAGAAYPWQSGSSGEEESARMHLNPRSGRWLPDDTHLQRHVGSAVAYNVWQYFETTGDLDFLSAYGAEMLIEIARYWASVAEWDDALSRYRIRGVVGPDEFHTARPGADRPGLDDNAYTNVMAAWCLRCAERALAELTEERQAELLRELGVTDTERRRWQRVGQRLRVVFMDDGVIAQFDGWQDLEELDFDALRARHGDIHRVDRILEQEGDSPNRYRVTKQADVLMLFYLFSADDLVELMRYMGYAFDRAAIPAHVDHYMRRTSHGSTLSRVVHSWVLARSDRARSWTLLTEALRSDICDIQGGTTAEGIHLGAMAGTVDLVRRGLTGAVVRDGVLRLDPQLPRELSELRLRFLVRGAWLEVRCDHREIEVGYHDGWPDEARVSVGGEVHAIPRGTQRTFRLAG